MVKLSAHVPTKNFKKFFWMEIHKIALYDHREGVVQSGAGGAPDTLLFLRKLPHGSKQPVLFLVSAGSFPISVYYLCHTFMEEFIKLSNY